MDVRIGEVEFDVLPAPVCVGFCEFDTLDPGDVRVGWCEFDVLAPCDVRVGFCEFDCLLGVESLMADPVGGKPKFKSSFRASTTPVDAPSRYHSHYADLEMAAALAAEQDDEEAVLTLLMMEFNHAV